MRKKLLAISVALIIGVILFSGCGGGKTNQGGNNGSSTQKPVATASLTVSVNSESGAPLNEANVNVEGKSAVTDNSGKASFASLKPGSYTVSAKKDGYKNAEKTVTLNSGDKKTVNLTLTKTAEENAAEQLNDISKLKSYRLTFESLSPDKKTGKMLIEEDDFGKEKHMVIYNGEGKVEMEFYDVNGKAKLRSGENGKWMSLPESSVKAMTDSSLGFVNDMMNGTVEDFNEAVKGKGGSVRYKQEKLGSETVNGYPTSKYRLYLEGHDEEGTGIIDSYLWVISKGQYKNYTTRMILNFKGTNGKTSKITVNLTDLGKDLHIALP